MRKALLRSLSLAVGLIAAPAYGQVPQPVRGARLGLPTSVTPIDLGVMPAGMLDAAADAPPPVPVPLGMPTPLGIFPTPLPTAPTVPPPTATALLPGTTPQSQGGPTVVPAPMPLPQSPSVTELRTPVGPLSAPGYPGYPSLTTAPYDGPPVVIEGGYPLGALPSTEVGPCPLGDCPTGTPLDRVCCSGNHFYASSEYLMWWTKSMSVPALLTTSGPGSSGILGAPGTAGLYGGDVGDTSHGGARFTVGDWLGCDSKWGVEGRFFFLGDDPSTFTANSNEYPVLARPFYNVNSPTGQFSELVAYPGLATGVASIKTQTELWGAEANLKRVLVGNPNSGGFELDAIVGYRFLDLDERLTIQEDFFRTPGSPMTVGTPAVAGNVTDIFHTTDVFNGGQIGVNASYQRGPWFIDSRATVAFGNLEQTAYINGGQTLYFANGSVGKYAGGLLALPGANMGTFHNSQFAVLPEVSLNLGCQITSHVRVFIGYDFLYLGNALRPGGAIDTNIDVARIPNFPVAGVTGPVAGPAQPSPSFTTSSFFAQGVNWGVQVKW